MRYLLHPHLGALLTHRRRLWHGRLASIARMLRVVTSVVTVMRAAQVALAWLTHLRLP